MSAVLALSTANTLPVPSQLTRSSVDIQANIDRLEQEAAAGAVRLGELVSAYDAAILDSDVAAEANEAETAAVRRSIRRAELRLIELRSEHKRVLADEAVTKARAQQREATAAVNALLDKIDKHYRKPAAIIRAFLDDYERVTEQAAAAGVPTPHQLTRYVASYTKPAYETELEVYIDEDGRETSSPYPPGNYSVNAQGQKLDPASVGRDQRVMPERPKRIVKRTVPNERVIERNLSSLPGLVSLPAACIDEDTFWFGHSIEDAFDEARKRR